MRRKPAPCLFVFPLPGITPPSFSPSLPLSVCVCARACLCVSVRVCVCVCVSLSLSVSLFSRAQLHVSQRSAPAAVTAQPRDECLSDAELSSALPADAVEIQSATLPTKYRDHNEPSL